MDFKNVSSPEIHTNDKCKCFVSRFNANDENTTLEETLAQRRLM